MRAALLLGLLVVPLRAGGLEEAKREAVRTGKPLMVVFRCVP